MRRVFLTFFLLIGLAACAGEPVWAPDEEVARARFASSGPPTITLMTMVNTNSGNGGHAALLISGSERLLFDPAGSFHHPRLPERNDVVYGMTDAAVDFYIDYHSRENWRVYKQDIVVSQEVAEMALRAIRDYGAVPKAFCTNAITTILKDLPGFESIRVTMFPTAAQEAFAKLPGVVLTEYQDDDPDNNGYLLARGI
jgi:hypothetical protein